MRTALGDKFYKMSKAGVVIDSNVSGMSVENAYYACLYGKSAMGKK